MRSGEIRRWPASDAEPDDADAWEWKLIPVKSRLVSRAWKRFTGPPLYEIALQRAA
jgi:hypothetical protein